VAELLASLVDKSLVVADLDLEQPRYWMLETIHEYAVERLAEAAEPQTADRHLTAFRELVRLTEPQLHGPRQMPLMGVLEDEQQNIRAALRHAVASGAEADALVLVLGMMWFWQVREGLPEARGWVDQVCALAPDPYLPGAPAPVPLDDEVLAHPLPWPAPVLQEARRQAWIYHMVARFDGAMDVVGDRDLVERAPRILVAYTPELPQSYSYPALLRIFATFLAGQADRTMAMVDQAVDGCRRLGRESQLAWMLQLRAKMSNDHAGHLGQARRDGEEAMAIYTRRGDSRGIGETLAALAETASFSGDSAAAAAHYRRAIELARELGASRELPLLLVRLGEAVLDEDAAEGERLIREGLAAAVRAGRFADGAMVFGHLLLGGLHAYRGDAATALAELAALEDGFRAVGNAALGLIGGLVACAAALILARCGDVDGAARRLHEGLSALRGVPQSAFAFAQHATLQLFPVVAGVVAIRAEADGDRELAGLAARLVGAQRGRLGVQGSYLERLERARREESLTAMLGDAEFERLGELGAGLSWEESAALLDEVLERL
jgi:tetratricopeptide (TPR) repeat protein